MLGGRDLAGRVLDQRGKVFARKPTDLDAKALGLHVELRPVDEVSGRRVEESKQAAQPTVVEIDPDSAATTPPWLRQSSSLP
jgi:hypothetical protein